MVSNPEKLFDYKQRGRTKEFGKGYDAIIWDSDKGKKSAAMDIDTRATKQKPHVKKKR